MSEIRIGSGDAGRQVEVAAGGALAVDLPEIPTTGYRWAVEEVDPSVLFLADADPEYADEPRPLAGAGRTRRLRFTAVGPGTTVLRLKNAQPWTPDAPDVEHFEVRVTVHG